MSAARASQHRHAGHELEQSRSRPGRGAGPASRISSTWIRARPIGLLPLGTVRSLESWTSSNYNALQLRAEKRYSHGLTFNASFNYQNALSIGYGVNEGGPFGNTYTQDPRNRVGRLWTVANRPAVPVRLLPRLGDPLDAQQPKVRHGWVLGGWSINGIVQLTSGLPVTVAQTGDSQNTGRIVVPAAAHRQPANQVDRVFDGRSLSINGSTPRAFVRSKCDGCAGEGIFLPKGLWQCRRLPVRRAGPEDLGLCAFQGIQDARRARCSSARGVQFPEHAAIPRQPDAGRRRFRTHHFDHHQQSRNAVWIEIHLLKSWSSLA